VKRDRSRGWATSRVNGRAEPSVAKPGWMRRLRSCLASMIPGGFGERSGPTMRLCHSRWLYAPASGGETCRDAAAGRTVPKPEKAAVGAPSRRARKAFEPIARTTIIRPSRRAPAPRDCEGCKARAHQSRGKALAWLFDNLIAIASSARPCHAVIIRRDCRGPQRMGRANGHGRALEAPQSRLLQRRRSPGGFQRSRRPDASSYHGDRFRGRCSQL